jgi:hypothetical protein
LENIFEIILIWKGLGGKLIIFRVLLPIDTAVSIMAINGYVYSNFQDFNDSMLIVWKFIFWGKVKQPPHILFLDFLIPIPNDPISIPLDRLSDLHKKNKTSFQKLN